MLYHWVSAVCISVVWMAKGQNQYGWLLVVMTITSYFRFINDDSINNIGRTNGAWIITVGGHYETNMNGTYVAREVRAPMLDRLLGQTLLLKMLG